MVRERPVWQPGPPPPLRSRRPTQPRQCCRPPETFACLRKHPDSAPFALR
jgi:hypothetical protein